MKKRIKRIKRRPRAIRTRRPRVKRQDTLSESQLEEKLLKALKFFIPELEVVQQYQFHPDIAWRMDFAYPAKQVSIEVQGYGPGHNSYDGMHGDYVKHNAAYLLGWRTIYFMSIDLEPESIDQTISTIRTILGLSNANKTKRPWSTQVEALRRRITPKPDI